jgi:hypothetical protein
MLGVGRKENFLDLGEELYFINGAVARGVALNLAKL